MNVVKKYSIKRYESESIERITDSVIVEYLFTIFLDGEEFITLTCTPQSLRELAIGFLHSESINDINNIELFEEKGYVNIELNNKDLLNEKSNKKRIITLGCIKTNLHTSSLSYKIIMN